MELALINGNLHATRIEPRGIPSTRSATRTSSVSASPAVKQAVKTFTWLQQKEPAPVIRLSLYLFLQLLSRMELRWASNLLCKSNPAIKNWWANFSITVFVGSDWWGWWRHVQPLLSPVPEQWPWDFCSGHYSQLYMTIIAILTYWPTFLYFSLMSQKSTVTTISQRGRCLCRCSTSSCPPYSWLQDASG